MRHPQAVPSPSIPAWVRASRHVRNQYRNYRSLVFSKCPLLACAVRRRRFPACENLTQQPPAGVELIDHGREPQIVPLSDGRLSHRMDGASPSPQSGDAGRVAPSRAVPGIRRHGTHQGIPIPRPQCHNAMIFIESGGPRRTRTWSMAWPDLCLRIGGILPVMLVKKLPDK
jgi:hypothetical protein